MTLALYSHPFAMYCWKPLIALHERELAFEAKLVEDRTELAELWPPLAELCCPPPDGWAYPVHARAAARQKRKQVRRRMIAFLSGLKSVRTPQRRAAGNLKALDGHGRQPADSLAK